MQCETLARPSREVHSIWQCDEQGIRLSLNGSGKVNVTINDGDFPIKPNTLSHIVNGDRPVTAEMALLFARALGQSAEYWLNLQAAYDLKTAEKAMRKRLQVIRPLAHA